MMKIATYGFLAKTFAKKHYTGAVKAIKDLKGPGHIIEKGNKWSRKNPKKALAIAGGTFVAANVGLATYGHKKYKQSKKKGS
jgi:hypothetical protein